MRFGTKLFTGLGGAVGCAVRLEIRRSRVQPLRGRQHSFVEINNERFSTVILSLPLIQEGQLSVSGERMCTKEGKRKVQEVPQSQTAALPRPQEEEETDKSKQAQIEQAYEKHKY